MTLVTALFLSRKSKICFNMKRQISFTVENGQDGISVLSFLRRYIGVPNAQIRAMKTYCGIKKQGSVIFTNAILHTGDVITLDLCDENEKSEGILPSDTPLNIAFENEDVLIVNKPYDMPTHPSHGHYTDSLANAVMGYYNKKGENFVFRAVTRLDRETSGLCVIAKNAFTHGFLIKQLHSDDFLREYTALVHGVIEEAGFVEAPIRRREQSIILRCVAPDGDYAYTLYTPIEKRADTTLLRLKLKTGRTHQIRVHMSHIGHALVGDGLYGIDKNERLCLHSSRVKLKLPFTNETVELSSDIPF